MDIKRSSVRRSVSGFSTVPESGRGNAPQAPFTPAGKAAYDKTTPVMGPGRTRPTTDRIANMELRTELEHEPGSENTDV
jgi:hypothetical protein